MVFKWQIEAFIRDPVTHESSSDTSVQRLLLHRAVIYDALRITDCERHSPLHTALINWFTRETKSGRQEEKHRL